MDNTKNIRVLSLCTGYGGLELALAGIFEAPLKVVSVERECFATANLVSKAEENKLDIVANYTDVKTFPSKKFRGCFDIIAAGFPCQPFSTAGKRLGGYDPRHLWPYIAEHIRTIKPVRVCLENVPGLLSASTLDNRPDLQRYLAELGKAEGLLDARERWYISQHRERLSKYFLRQEGVQAYAAIYYSLRDLGYSVEAGLFTASEVGAPHKRQRLFILANTRSRERDWLSSKQRETDISIRNSCELADAGCKSQRSEIARSDNKFKKMCEEEVRTGSRDRSTDTSDSKLADTDKERTQRPEPERTAQTGRQIDKQSYPARPGQPQYEWEKPRTVKPGMGRTVNGFASRVDELRLLGNGVVPAQAELAFRALWLSRKYL